MPRSRNPARGRARRKQAERLVGFALGCVGFALLLFGIGKAFSGEIESLQTLSQALSQALSQTLSQTLSDPAPKAAPKAAPAPVVTEVPAAPPTTPPGPVLDPDRPPNVLLITLCSVRADRVGPSGHASADTPTLDALATEGVWFSHAWAPATFTLPSHASMFTGLLPSRAGVMETVDTIRSSVPTLPEILKLYGYHTVAYAPVSSRASFSAGYGFERGFDKFIEGGSGAASANLGDLTALDAITSAQPYFAVVHLKEAHPPYTPSRRTKVDPRILEWITRSAGGPGGGGPGAQNPDEWMVGQMRDDPALASAVAGLYDDALRRVDEHVGRILEGLRTRGALDHTIVIVAGDHGQALGEGGHIGHQGLLQPEVLNVPLLVRMPSDMPEASRGLRVDADVGLVDLLPTIVDLVDATPPATLDGRSLVPLLQGEALPERGALAQAVVQQSDGRGLATEVLVHGPLWLNFPMRGQGAWSLRRLSNGVWEPVDGADGADRAAAPMLAERALLSGVEAPPGTPAALTAKQKEELRLQGYW